MRPSSTVVLVLLFLGQIHVARGGDQTTSKDLSKIQPPGGVPIPLGPRGTTITVERLRKVMKRLESAPSKDLDKWLVELERIMDEKLEGLAIQGCRYYFVSRMSVAFDDHKWNAKAADMLFRRARTMPASEAKLWKEVFEAVLKKEIGQTTAEVFDGGPAYAVPLVLIPMDVLYEGQMYSAARRKMYLARMKQLTVDDISFWINNVDQFGGTELDAAVNIILLDDYFEEGKFRRADFRAAIAPTKK